MEALADAPCNDSPLARWRARLSRPDGGGTDFLPKTEKSRSISQEDAAKACCVSRQLWAAWERRTRPISLQQADRIARVLRLTDTERLELLSWGEEPLRGREPILGPPEPIAEDGDAT